MARFYAEIQGNRGPATRMGDSRSGMYSHTRGWGIGAEVTCHVSPDGEDRIHIALTSGSNGGPSRILGTFRRRGKQLVKCS